MCNIFVIFTPKFIAKLGCTNILYALAPTRVEIGTLRETFAIGCLSESHNVEYGKAQGDFKVDGKFTFEIGGRSKDFSQIAGVRDSYVFADDWVSPMVLNSLSGCWDSCIKYFNRIDRVGLSIDRGVILFSLRKSPDYFAHFA